MLNNMKNTMLRCLLVLSCGLVPLEAAAEPVSISQALEALDSVHALDEVAMSPNGKQLVYGTEVAAMRNGKQAVVSALLLADARDGSHVRRLTACPGAACDEYSAAWSPAGTHLTFVTTDASGQPQLAVAAADASAVQLITHAQGPLDTPRWSPDGKRIAFLYSAGAPKRPGPLNPLTRDAGVLTSTVYEQRLALIAAAGWS